MLWPGSEHGVSNQSPYVWQMIKESVEALGSPTTNVSVRDWILSKYPGTNKTTIQCQIIVCTVNHRSRIHYSENQKPRQATAQYDFLFRPEKGKLEWYDPKRHGGWQIRRDESGRLTVALLGEESEELDELSPTTGADKESGHAFAQEAHLRDYLARHLDTIEPGLQLFVDENGVDGLEYQTDVGRIDILAVDAQDRFFVIELKVAKGPDSASGQVLRYVNWVRAHLAGSERVRGLIVAQNVSKKICYAIASDPDVSAMEYEISLSLRPPDTEVQIPPSGSATADISSGG